MNKEGDQYVTNYDKLKLEDKTGKKVISAVNYLGASEQFKD
jgi:hypothetical protein